MIFHWIIKKYFNSTFLFGSCHPTYSSQRYEESKLNICKIIWIISLNPECELYENKYCTLLKRVGSLGETAGLILQFNLQIVERTKTETRNIIGFTFNLELLTNLVTILFCSTYVYLWLNSTNGLKVFQNFIFSLNFRDWLNYLDKGNVKI